MDASRLLQTDVRISTVAVPIIGTLAALFCAASAEWVSACRAHCESLHHGTALRSRARASASSRCAVPSPKALLVKTQSQVRRCAGWRSAHLGSRIRLTWSGTTACLHPGETAGGSWGGASFLARRAKVLRAQADRSVLHRIPRAHPRARRSRFPSHLLRRGRPRAAHTGTVPREGWFADGSVRVCAQLASSVEADAPRRCIGSPCEVSRAGLWAERQDSRADPGMAAHPPSTATSVCAA